MPCNGDPGRLPPLRELDGAAILRLAAAAKVHHLVGADELSRGMARDPWHAFADLMGDAAVVAATLGDADRTALAARLDAAVADLRAAGARVIAGSGGGILYVAVLPKDRKRDPRFLFAAG
jgi:hypothetical protein